MTDSHLSELQLARAEALDRARAVLVGRNLVGSGGVEHPFEVVGLARYIHDGADIFNEATQEAVAE